MTSNQTLIRGALICVFENCDGHVICEVMCVLQRYAGVGSVSGHGHYVVEGQAFQGADGVVHLLPRDTRTMLMGAAHIALPGEWPSRKQVPKIAASFSQFNEALTFLCVGGDAFVYVDFGSRAGFVDDFLEGFHGPSSSVCIENGGWEVFAAVILAMGSGAQGAGIFLLCLGLSDSTGRSHYLIGYGLRQNSGPHIDGLHRLVAQYGRHFFCGSSEHVDRILLIHDSSPRICIYCGRRQVLSALIAAAGASAHSAWTGDGTEIFAILMIAINCKILKVRPNFPRVLRAQFLARNYLSTLAPKHHAEFRTWHTIILLSGELREVNRRNSASGSEFSYPPSGKCVEIGSKFHVFVMRFAQLRPKHSA